MHCKRCGSLVKEVYSEELKCSHCSEINIVAYHVCAECGAFYKTVDGHVVDNSNSVSILVADDGNYDEKFGNVLSDVAGYIRESVGKVPESMSALLHRCIMCNERAYEIEEGFYKCASCNFSWEVIECE